MIKYEIEGGIKNAFGRLFSGESIFMNEYTAEGGTGMIAFASSFPGSIIPYQVTAGNGIVVHNATRRRRSVSLAKHFFL